MCGVFGFISYGNRIKNTKKLAQELAWASTERGMDATGVAYVQKGKIIINKKGINAYDFEFSKEIKGNPQVLMGHTRKLTQGSAKKNYNNHPFYINTKDGRQFAFAHNGSVLNDYELRYQEDLPGTNIETDSYVVAQMLEKLGDVNYDTIREVASKVEAYLVFTFLDEEENIILVKGDKPLAIAHFPELKLWVYASTSEILFNALAQFPQTAKILLKKVIGDKKARVEWIEPKLGDIIKITKKGILEKTCFEFNDAVYDYFYKRTKTNKGKRKYLSLAYASYSTAIPYDGYYQTLENDEFANIVAYARNYGITEQQLDLLREYGYTVDEIRELMDSGDIFSEIENVEIQERIGREMAWGRY